MRTLVASLVLLLAPSTQAQELLIHGARLIDGSGAPPQEHISVRIQDGRILEIGRELEPRRGEPVIEAAGMTLLPGMIDSHAHFIVAPGHSYRQDTPKTTRELNRQHLRASLACGVTTVLDPGNVPGVIRDIQDWLASGEAGPRYLTTGPYVRPPGGYGYDAFGSEATPEEMVAKLDSLQELGAVGIKLAIEKGLWPNDDFTLFEPEVLDTLKRESKRRGLPIYVHANTEETYGMALDVGAHAIMHTAVDVPVLGSWLAAPELSDALLERMAESGVYLLTTLSVYDTMPNHYDVSQLDDPRLELVVPELELQTARAEDAEAVFAHEVLAFIAPWTFDSLRPWTWRTFITRQRIGAGIAYGQRNILRAHKAGVPIVIATDVPSPWPAAIYHFHGAQYAREAELVVEAGLTPLQAIASATSVPARMLGLEKQIGTIEVGKRADLVLVEGDPSQDIRALREVHWTVRDGLARTPASWMKR